MKAKALYIISGFLFLLCATETVAQQDPNYTFYRYHMNLINPAYAGAGMAPEFALNVRSQWAGVSGAPETQSAFFGINTGKNVGLGLSFINDRTFIENQTSVSVDFSYQVKLGDRDDLFLGVKAGANSYTVNEEGLTTFGIGTDPSLNGLNGGFTPNIGAGAYLKGEKYFVSFSVPRILSPDRLERNNGEASLGVDRVHMYFSAGYDFDLGGDTVFKPSTLIRYVDAAPVSVDLTAALSLAEHFEVAANYRLDEGAGGYFMFRATQKLDLGYAYGATLHKPVNVNSNGSHEVFIKFRL